ncbi:MAG TPA: hypothetical protein VHW96_11685 [Solirubrobacteraceae bacterium]|jgi:hypothetical protein|nr:hypothetical protein [Solirubrobacteraceae bacterium]
MRLLRDTLEYSREDHGPDRVKARQKLTPNPPFEQQLVRLTEISVEVLTIAFGPTERDRLIAEAKKLSSTPARSVATRWIRSP